jgi:hypothetical protein
MEQFIAAAAAELLKYGLPGIFIGCLIYKIVKFGARVGAKDPINHRACRRRESTRRSRS